MGWLKKFGDPKTVQFTSLAISIFVIGVGTSSNDETGISSIFTLAGMVMIIITIIARRKHKKSMHEAEKFAQYEASPIVQAAHKIENGVLPVFADSSIVRKGEITHFSCQAVRYITKNRVVGKTGSYGGASFHIAKGVTLRSGGVQGHSVYGDVTGSFLGEFILTNKRVMFVHGEHGFQSTLGSLDAVSEGDQGKVILQKGNTSCVLHIVVSIDERTSKMSTIQGPDILIKAIALIHAQADDSANDGDDDDVFDGSAEKIIDANPLPKASVADEIMKFKNLLDAGAITDEEYEAKKKVLLGN